MTLTRMTLFFVSLGMLTSCQSLVDNMNMQSIQAMLTPKASPEMVAMIKDKAAGVSFSPAEKIGKSSQKRMPLKAGQWLTTLTTHKNVGGDLTLSTTRVISVSDTRVVMETESYSAVDKGRRQLAQIIFENYPNKGPLSLSQADYDATIRNIRIVSMKTRTGDQPVQIVPEEALALSQGLTQGFTGAGVRSGELTSDACRTDYIVSSRCYTFDFTVSLMGITRSGRSTVHSRIPVTGLVRMETEDMVQETIAFGTSGAHALF